MQKKRTNNDRGNFKAFGYCIQWLNNGKCRMPNNTRWIWISNYNELNDENSSCSCMKFSSQMWAVQKIKCTHTVKTGKYKKVTPKNWMIRVLCAVKWSVSFDWICCETVCRKGWNDTLKYNDDALLHWAKCRYFKVAHLHSYPKSKNFGRLFLLLKWNPSNHFNAHWNSFVKKNQKTKANKKDTHTQPEWSLYFCIDTQQGWEIHIKIGIISLNSEGFRVNNNNNASLRSSEWFNLIFDVYFWLDDCFVFCHVVWNERKEEKKTVHTVFIITTNSTCERRGTQTKRMAQGATTERMKWWKKNLAPMIWTQAEDAAQTE